MKKIIIILTVSLVVALGGGFLVSLVIPGLPAPGRGQSSIPGPMVRSSHNDTEGAFNHWNKVSGEFL
jgi:hypothetical protein